MANRGRNYLLYFFLLFWGIYLLKLQWDENQNLVQIPYSEFRDRLAKNQIEEIQIYKDFVRGTFKKDLNDIPLQERPEKIKFITVRVDESLSEELSRHQVKYSQIQESSFLKDLASWLLPIILMMAFWIYLGRRLSGGGGLGGGLLSVGKSKAKIYMETDIKTTFADIAGIDEAKEDLSEIIHFLKDPQGYGKLGARMPKGILLVGPPGTGKTLLAKAVAGEAGVPFFSMSGSEFVELFVGVGAARVRDLFEQARQKAPCIIFIDELDALGRARGVNPLGGGHDEKEQTLNQLLAELDGFDTKAGVILLAATNRPEILDPALLRAGRFDRQILVDRPDKKGRLDILKVHIRKIILAPDLDLEPIANMTPGFTGADLANLVNEAALTATRRRAGEVTNQDFLQAIERIVAGLERRNRLLNPMERRIVAYHEMGHALVALKLPGTDRIQKVSIIPRGVGALGYTIQRPIEDRYLMSKQELLNKMTVLMGGRAAEKIVFQSLSTGAADDLSRATDMARNIVTRFGMSEELGPIALETEPSSFIGKTGNPFERRLYSEATAQQIDATIKKLLQETAAQAEAILLANKTCLVEGAEILLTKETLNEEEILQLLPGC